MCVVGIVAVCGWSCSSVCVELELCMCGWSCSSVCVGVVAVCVCLEL